MEPKISIGRMADFGGVSLASRKGVSQPVGKRSGLGQPSGEVSRAWEVRGGTNGTFPVAFRTPSTMHGP